MENIILALVICSFTFIVAFQLFIFYRNKTVNIYLQEILNKIESKAREDHLKGIMWQWRFDLLEKDLTTKTYRKLLLFFWKKKEEIISPFKYLA